MNKLSLFAVWWPVLFASYFIFRSILLIRDAQPMPYWALLAGGGLILGAAILIYLKLIPASLGGLVIGIFVMEAIGRLFQLKMLFVSEAALTVAFAIVAIRHNLKESRG